jgi:hypothetical protein
MSHAPPTNDPLLLERAYIEGWVLALTFGAEEELRAANVGTGLLVSAMSIIGQIIVIKWPKLRARIAERTPNFTDKFSALVSDPRWWVATLAIFLMFLALSPYIQQRRWPFSWQLTEKLELAPRPAPPAPRVLSDDEKQFRFDLRKFILSDVSQTANAFMALAFRLSTIDSNTHFYKDRPTTEAADNLFDSAIRQTFLPKWGVLSDETNKPVEQLNVPKIVAAFKDYVTAYNQSVLYLRDFLFLSGQDPNQNSMLENWLSWETRTIQAYSDLASSPVARDVGIANSGFPSSASRLQAYISPSNPQAK